MAKTEVRPYLISKDADGRFRLTIRETNYNSQGFAWVKTTLHEDVFAKAADAKAYARDHFGAKAGEYAKE